MTEDYDLAVSFAGEQRDYVARTVDACKDLGLRVFYDKDKNNDWWGSNFIRQQRNIYSSQTRFFVPFLSTEYLAKPIPMDEFSAAMMTAVKKGDGYILPVLVGDVQVPADLLHPHIHYLRSSEFTPEQLAQELAKKVGSSRSSGAPTAELGHVVEQALQFRMPKVVPAQWSKYEELNRVFEYVCEQFKAGAPQLRDQGFVCTVEQNQDKLLIRVERGGTTVFGLNINKGGSMGDDHITWSVGHGRLSDNSFNGWATPHYDKVRQRTVMDVTDMASMFAGGAEIQGGLSSEEFFQLFWDKMVDQLEHS